MELESHRKGGIGEQKILEEIIAGPFLNLIKKYKQN